MWEVSTGGLFVGNVSITASLSCACMWEALPVPLGGPKAQGDMREHQESADGVCRLVEPL
jgi:hypothetical protein